MDAKQFEDLPIVHNCWTVYTDSLGIDAWAEFRRPQDWGHPRWMYRVYRFSAPNLSHTVIVHGWLEQQEVFQPEEYEHAQFFASHCGTIMLPGHNEKECGRDYLIEDDFWDSAWGDMPPFLDENDGEVNYE